MATIGTVPAGQHMMQNDPIFLFELHHWVVAANIFPLGEFPKLSNTKRKRVVDLFQHLSLSICLLKVIIYCHGILEPVENLQRTSSTMC